jgi:uncharacterized protein involved in exopolysaccharide biosynthesis
MDEQLRILKPYWRGFPLIILCMMAAVMIAKKYLSYVTPMYEATAKLKLADVSEGVPSSNLFKNLDVFATTNKITAEIEVIRSQVLISTVLDSLDFDQEVKRIGKVRSVELYHESPFVIHASLGHPQFYDKPFLLTVLSQEAFILEFPNASGKVNGTFGEVVNFADSRLLIELRADVIQSKSNFALIDQYSVEFLSREKLIRSIQQNLDIVAVDKDVPVIRISFKSPIPEKAAAIVNRMATCYIHDYIETKYRAAHTTVRFLDGRISDVAKKLAASEQSIQQYRDTRAITNLAQETETDLRKISQLKVQEANLRMSLDAIIELEAYMKGGSNILDLAPNFEAFTDLLSTEIVKKIKELQAEKHDLLLTFTPADERVQVIDQKIDDLGSYLRESIGNTRTNLQTKYDRLAQEIHTAEQAFVGIPEKERMLTILQREFDIYQRSYNFLNEKKIEAEIAQAARIAFHRLISPALPSHTPVSPNRIIILIVAAMLGMFGSMAVIFLIHMLKGKVNDVSTIERNSLIPLIGQTPYLKREEDRTRHFQKLAIELELKRVAATDTRVVISSWKDHEGRTLHARYLARALAQQGRNVLLIELHKEQSSITSQKTSLCNNVDLLELSTGHVAKLTQATLQNLLASYRTLYDLLIINNEPLERNEASFLLMSMATTNLVILDARATPKKQIAVLNRWQHEFAFPNLNFVLNRGGYNPNVLVELYTFYVRMYNRIKKRT